jgi:hypothetical protein
MQRRMDNLCCAVLHAGCTFIVWVGSAEVPFGYEASVACTYTDTLSSVHLVQLLLYVFEAATAES